VTTALRRGILVVLAISTAALGGWAYFGPHSWYATFPGFGRHWLSPDSPYNEHFVKDIGAGFLALTVLSCAALVYVRNDAVVRTVAAVALAFGVLHLIYHVQTLHMYDTQDKVLNMIALVIPVLLAASLFIPVRPRVD
jgi:heme/copper-type cytochrome/quinol oxidase subunit 4